MIKNAFLVLVAVSNAYCTPRTVQTPETVIYGDEVATVLPERPDSEPIPEGEDWVVPVSVGEMVDAPGVCMSDAKAMRSARYVVAYNEIRSLYQSDLRTWNREREIYQRYLHDAESQVQYWREKSRRTWWERHAAQVGLAAGVVIGAGLAVGLVYGLNEAVGE